MRIFWCWAVNYEISPFSLSELPSLHEIFSWESKKIFRYPVCTRTRVCNVLILIKNGISWLGKSHSVSSRMLKSVHNSRPRLGGEKFLKKIQEDINFNFVPSSDRRYVIRILIWYKKCFISLFLIKACLRNKSIILRNLILKDQSCSPDGKMLL